MKTGQNRTKAKNCFKNYIGLTTIVCLTLFCLIAEGQNIRMEKTDAGDRAIVDFKPEVRPNSKTLVEYMVSKNLKEGSWVCDKVEIIGPDGEPKFVFDFNISDDEKMFFKAVQTDISEAGHIDHDNDGISTLFELLNDGPNMDPLSTLQLNPDPEGNVSDVVKVMVEKTEVVAGGFDSELYQTKVTLDVGLAGVPLRVWAEGSGVLKNLNGDSYVASDVAQPEQALQVVTGSNGIAELILTSSEVINDSCRVIVNLGDIFDADVTQQVMSEQVHFMQGDMTLNFDHYPLRSGSIAKAIVRRSFRGEPLSGHRIQLSVGSAKINGEMFNSTESDMLQDLIAVGSDGDSNASYVTNEDGECLIDFYVPSLESLQSIGITAADSSQKLR